MKKRNHKWYYVSLYEKSAAYEPAEGGYYYDCSEIIESYRVRSLRKARKLLAEYAEEYGLKVCGNHAYGNYKYIGDGFDVHIETVFGKHNSGIKPYC